MRFSVHLIVCGRFYPAGVEVPDSVTVPGGAMDYAIDERRGKVVDDDLAKAVVVGDDNSLLLPEVFL